MIQLPNKGHFSGLLEYQILYLGIALPVSWNSTSCILEKHFLYLGKAHPVS
jgi:hypothetical protein